jgi:hypothetical protein
MSCVVGTSTAATLDLNAAAPPLRIHPLTLRHARKLGKYLWRKRVGVEPTKDRMSAPARFEV